MKIPYTLVLGDNEKDNRLISYRLFSSKDTTTVTIDEYIELLKNEINNK